LNIGNNEKFHTPLIREIFLPDPPRVPNKCTGEDEEVILECTRMIVCAKVIGCTPDLHFLSREMNTSETKMDRAVFPVALTDAICIKNDSLSRRFHIRTPQDI